MTLPCLRPGAKRLERQPLCDPRGGTVFDRLCERRSCVARDGSKTRRLRWDCWGHQQFVGIVDLYMLFGLQCDCLGWIWNPKILFLIYISS